MPSKPGNSHPEAGRGPRPDRPWSLRVVFYLFLGIAAFYLITEHRAHLVAGLYWLPFLLFAACPLMHVLGHGGHRHHGDSPRDRADKPALATTDDREPASSISRHPHGGDRS